MLPPLLHRKALQAIGQKDLDGIKGTKHVISTRPYLRGSQKNCMTMPAMDGWLGNGTLAKMKSIT